MSVYYNEIDPFAAAWLRNLMDAGHIPAGEVDTRSIADVRPDDLRGVHQAHFFAGIGGWPYALRLAGWPDDRPVWTGSCPCQPFSAAGKRRGTADERHLWPVFGRLIAECRPPVVFGEQVASRDGREWFSCVRSDLEALAYAVGGADLCAAGVGAEHNRARIWWVADAERDQQPREKSRCRPAGRVGRLKQPVPWVDGWPIALSLLRVVDDGLPRSVAATDAARNAIVPQVAARFVTAFMECMP